MECEKVDALGGSDTGLVNFVSGCLARIGGIAGVSVNAAQAYEAEEISSALWALQREVTDEAQAVLAAWFDKKREALGLPPLSASADEVE